MANILLQLVTYSTLSFQHICSEFGNANIMRLRTFKLITSNMIFKTRSTIKQNTAPRICVVRTIVPMMSRVKAKSSMSYSDIQIDRYLSR